MFFTDAYLSHFITSHLSIMTTNKNKRKRGPKKGTIKNPNIGQGLIKKKLLDAKMAQEGIEQLGTVVEVIRDVIGDLQSDRPSKHAKTLQIVADATTVAKSQLEASTKSLAPMAGHLYASRHLKCEKEREVAIETGVNQDESAVRRAQLYVRENKENLHPSTKKTRKKRVSVKPLTITFGSKARNPKSLEICVPAPANGKMYTPREVLDIVVPLSTKERGFLH